MTDRATITAVIFDLGGVLIDWNPNYLYERLVPDPSQREQFLTTICTPEWNHEMDAGRSVPEAVAALARQHPAYAHLINAWWTNWPEMLGGDFPDTVDLAQRLATEGIPLFALTNWAADTWPYATNRFPFLTTLFDGIVVSGQEGLAKPDQRIYALIGSRYNLNPTHTAFIDDSPANIAAAAALGYRTHHFTTASQLEAWLADEALIAGA